MFTKKPVDFSYAIYEVTNLIGLYVKMGIIYSILSIWWKNFHNKRRPLYVPFPRVQYVKGDFKTGRFLCSQVNLMSLHMLYTKCHIH